MLITHLYPLLRLRVSGAIPLLPLLCNDLPFRFQVQVRLAEDRVFQVTQILCVCCMQQREVPAQVEGDICGASGNTTSLPGYPDGSPACVTLCADLPVQSERPWALFRSESSCIPLNSVHKLTCSCAVRRIIVTWYCCW